MDRDEVFKSLVEHQHRVDLTSDTYPSINKLRAYSSRNYSEARELERKAQIKSDLAFKAGKLEGNFTELMIMDEEKLRYKPKLRLYQEDPVQIKLMDLGRYFTDKFYYLIDDYSLTGLSEGDKKQRELILKYIRDNPPCKSRSVFEDEARVYKNLMEACINAGINSCFGVSSSRDELYKYEREFEIFIKIWHNFLTGVSNKVIERKFTRREYEHLLNTSIEQLFYEITEESGLVLR